MPSPKIKGTLTTIRWGTGGVLQAPLSGAIVKSIRVARLGGEPIKIEDNDGFTAIVVQIVDGDRLEITVVDDTSKTWPVPGDVISLKGPNDANPKNCLVVDTGEGLERKREGERTIVAEFYVGIALS